MIRFLFLACLLSCQCPRDEQKDFAILFTTNTQGYVQPCGCTADPLGGISRLASLVNDVNQDFSNKTLFVDAGNLLFDTTSARPAVDLCQDEARIDLLLSTLKSLGVVGTVPGPYDDARGDLFRNAILKKHSLDVFGVNSEKIIKRGNFNIGVVGFRASEFSATMRVELQAALHRLTQTDVNIVVAQAPLAVIQQMVQGFDIVIQGQDTGEKPLPAQALSPKGPWIVSAAMQGQYLGVLEFHMHGKKKGEPWFFDDRLEKQEIRRRILNQRLEAFRKRDSTAFIRERIAEIEQELALSETLKPLSQANFILKQIPIRHDVKPDKVVQLALEKYEKNISNLVTRCEQNFECPRVKPGEATFVGAETCKTCHAASYEVWKKTQHADAWPTLEKVSKTSDRSCIGCHSIGFMQPGGYCKSSDVSFRRGVQCESCHGPGSLHAASGDKRLIKRHVPESTCRSCHHVPHIPTTESFVYEEKLQKILGPGHGHPLLQKPMKLF